MRVEAKLSRTDRPVPTGSPEKSVEVREETIPSHRPRRTRYVLSAIVFATILAVVSCFLPDRSPVEPSRLLQLETRWGLEDDSVDSIELPDDYRFTWLQAAARPQADTYRDASRSPWFVEMVVFYEKRMTERIADRWQSVLAAEEVIPRIDCVMETAQARYRTTATRRRFKDFVELLQCDIERGLEAALGLNVTTSSTDRLTVTLQLHLASTQRTFSVIKDLIPYTVESPAAGSLGVCLAPVWGDLELGELLEWREWHRLLGIYTVHWFSRGGPLELVVASYNRETGARDTFRRARPLTPEAYSTNADPSDLLEAQGLSHDQVVAYADCKLRSTYRNPTQWLAYIDLDEFLQLRDTPADPAARRTALADYFAGQPADVGSIRFFRTLPGLPKVDTGKRANTTALLGLAESDAWHSLYWGAMSTYMLPQEGHPQFQSNTKYIHRVNGVEASGIHEGLSLYPGMRQTEESDGEVMLAHVGGQLFAEENLGPHATVFPATEGWNALHRLWASNKLALGQRLLCDASIRCAEA